jgi:hypothetical protein
MSVDYSVYIGVYLQFPYQEEEITNISYVDVNGKKTGNKFDPNTGQPNLEKLEIIKKEVIPNPWIEGVPGLGKDTFTTYEWMGGKKVSTFILSRSGKYCREIGDVANCDLSEVDPPSIISDFKIEYCKYLDYYRGKFGDFSIKFGVVYYAN